MRHIRKITNEWLPAVLDGRKTWEVRLNDRPEGFRVGDLIELHEVSWFGAKPLDGRALVEITYVATGVPGVQDGYVVLGIRLLPWDGGAS